MKVLTKDNLRYFGASLTFAAILTGVPVSFGWSPSLAKWLWITVPIGLLLWIACLFRKEPQPDRVFFDETRITRTMPSGKTETVEWNDLQEIKIFTTDEGPMVEDVFWLLAGNNGGCAVTGGAQGMKELLFRLQQLPGFDNGAVINAMGSTANASFVCWKRGSGEAESQTQTGGTPPAVLASAT